MKKQQLRYVKKQNLLIMYSCPLFLFACLYSMPQQPTASTTGPETVDSVEKIGVQGNWVKKRDWLIKANEVNNDIQEITVQIEPVRKLYIEKQNEIDDVLDAYYNQLGVEEGKVQELFDSILRYLDKKRKKDLATLVPQEGDQKDPDLQAKIDVLEESIKTSKQQLEQLKLDMKSIEDLDRSLAERIKRMDEYINKIHEDANRAKVLTNEMWNIIDHNKARANYYELKNAILEKLKSIQTYLKDDLFKDFEAVIDTIKKQITITQDQIKKLETDGIFVKNRSQRIEALKLKELQLKREDTERMAQSPKTPEKAKKQLTWKETLYSYWTSITQKLFGVWKWITTKVLGPDTPPTSTPKASQQQSATPATTANQPPAQQVSAQSTTTPITVTTEAATPPTQTVLPTQEQTTPSMPAQEAAAQAMPSA